MLQRTTKLSLGARTHTVQNSDIHVVIYTLVLTSTVVRLNCFQDGNELKYIYIVLKFVPFPKAAMIQNKLVTQFHLSDGPNKSV